MTQLICSCLLSVIHRTNGTSQEVRCGTVFDARSTWEFGSYCSWYCSQHDLEAIPVRDAAPDMQTPDQHFGINAFRVLPRQQGALEEREQQSTD